LGLNDKTKTAFGMVLLETTGSFRMVPSDHQHPVLIITITYLGCFEVLL